MSSQTAGALSGPSSSSPDRGHGAVAEHVCATRLSLARGAVDAAPCKAPMGGGVGGPRAVGGPCASAAGVAGLRPHAGPPRQRRETPRRPPRPDSDLHRDVIRFSCASTGTGRDLPTGSHHPYRPALKAGLKEEN